MDMLLHEKKKKKSRREVQSSGLFSHVFCSSSDCASHLYSSLKRPTSLINPTLQGFERVDCQGKFHAHCFFPLG